MVLYLIQKLMNKPRISSVLFFLRKILKIEYLEREVMNWDILELEMCCRMHKQEQKLVNTKDLYNSTIIKYETSNQKALIFYLHVIFEMISTCE